MNDLKEYSEKIKQELTIEQVEELLADLGGAPQRKNDIIISRTICHNGDSHKLYYYSNTQLFKCFTQCDGDSFDIYDLIIKINKTKGIEINLYQSINYIIKYFNLGDFNSFSSFNNNEALEDWKILNKYENNNDNKEQEKTLDFKFYDKNILKYLPKFRLPMWLREGISQEVMDNCGIAFDPVSWGIVIPHYNIDNNLIGIRERTLIKEEEENGKYKPAFLNYQLYNHPLGFNLYGLNWAKENIKILGKAIVFEGEKSVLLYQSYFGIDNSIAVAVCGSNLTKYQVDLLINCGTKEIIIAFDKQFKEIGNEEWKRWTNKLKEINKKYSSIVQISFMFDKEDLLEYKMSPIDNGKEVFLELFKRRVSL